MGKSRTGPRSGNPTLGSLGFDCRLSASRCGVPQEEMQLILGGNMVRVYGLEEVFAGRATELVGVK
jgi:hypothetical protein